MTDTDLDEAIGLVTAGSYDQAAIVLGGHIDNVRTFGDELAKLVDLCASRSEYGQVVKAQWQLFEPGQDSKACSKARNLLREYSRRPDPMLRALAMTVMGKHLQDVGDFQTSLIWLRPPAETGFKPAMIAFAEVLTHDSASKAPIKHVRNAIKAIKPLIDEDDPEAQALLAIWSLKGYIKIEGQDPHATLEHARKSGSRIAKACDVKRPVFDRAIREPIGDRVIPVSMSRPIAVKDALVNELGWDEAKAESAVARFHGFPRWPDMAATSASSNTSGPFDEDIPAASAFTRTQIQERILECEGVDSNDAPTVISLLAPTRRHGIPSLKRLASAPADRRLLTEDAVIALARYMTASGIKGDPWSVIDKLRGAAPSRPAAWLNVLQSNFGWRAEAMAAHSSKHGAHIGNAFTAAGKEYPIHLSRIPHLPGDLDDIEIETLMHEVANRRSHAVLLFSAFVHHESAQGIVLYGGKLLDEDGWRDFVLSPGGLDRAVDQGAVIDMAPTKRCREKFAFEGGLDELRAIRSTLLGNAEEVFYEYRHANGWVTHSCGGAAEIAMREDESAPRF